MTVRPFRRVIYLYIVTSEKKNFATRTSGVVADINSQKLLLGAVLTVFPLYSLSPYWEVRRPNFQSRDSKNLLETPPGPKIVQIVIIMSSLILESLQEGWKSRKKSGAALEDSCHRPRQKYWKIKLFWFPLFSLRDTEKRPKKAIFENWCPLQCQRCALQKKFFCRNLL